LRGVVEQRERERDGMNGEWGSFTNTDRSEEKKNKSQKKPARRASAPYVWSTGVSPNGTEF
jgi:hypothetical protein